MLYLTALPLIVFINPILRLSFHHLLLCILFHHLIAMEGKVFLVQNLLWVILLLMGQLHGYKSCINREMKGFFELKKYIVSITREEQYDFVLPTRTNDTTSDCCRWKGVECNRISGRVTEIIFGGLSLKK